MVVGVGSMISWRTKGNLAKICEVEINLQQLFDYTG